MYRKDYSVEFIKRTIEKRGLNGLSIFDDLDPLPSLDFLRECDFLKYLAIQCIHDQNFDFLRELPQLEHLSAGLSVTMNNEIDLSNQTNLTHLALEWRKGRILGLENCSKIGDLCLIDFNEDSLELVRARPEITRLRIKTGSVRSLDGIDALNRLVEAEIGNCRRLRSISHLNGLPNLATLRIESCRKITDYEDLDELPKLKSLNLINCGDIPNIHFEDRFPSLEEFRLLEKTKLVG